MNIISLFDQLQSTNSKLDKEKILLDNIDNEYFRELLVRNLNPYELYQVNVMPATLAELNSFDKFEPRTNYKCFILLLDKLAARKVTGNIAKQEIIDVFKRMDSNEYNLYSKILLKEAIGVGAKTVNKVYGKGFVPTFEVLLAPSELADVTKVSYPCYSQYKMDGLRTIYIPNNTDGDLFTRTGKVLGNKNLKTYFKSLFNISDYVLDGELFSYSRKFEEIFSILSNENTPIPDDIKFVVFDSVPLKDWKKQDCKIVYQDRLTKVRELLNGVVADYKKVIDIPTDKLNSSMEFKPIYKKYLQNKFEGAIIRDMNGLYEWKRTSVKSGVILKVKPFKSADLEITGTYDGEGNFEDTCGGFICNFNGVTVRIGSGFSMELRSKIKANPEEFIGKIAEVKYQEETEDGSLRFPTLIRMRPDK